MLTSPRRTLQDPPPPPSRHTEINSNNLQQTAIPRPQVPPAGNLLQNTEYLPLCRGKIRKEKINFALNRQESGQQARLLAGSYIAARFISSSFPVYLAPHRPAPAIEAPFVPPPAYSVPELLNAPFLLYMKASGNVYISKGSKDVFEAPSCQPDEPGEPGGACQPASRAGRRAQGTRSLASKILW